MNLVFIVGTGRCGSSLVHEVLARHPDFGFISNIDDNVSFLDSKGRFNNSLYGSPLGNFTAKGKPRFAPSEAYRLVSRQVSPIYANSSRDLVASDVSPWLEARFRAFFAARWEAQGRSVFSHKYTGWSRMGFFKRIFPDAKFIHIIRDGRAVANSWLQMQWWGGYRGPQNWLWGELDEVQRQAWKSSGESYFYLAGLSWSMLMQAFRAAEEELPDSDYLNIRYEDVLEHPRDNFARMLEFCNVSWNDGFERHFRRHNFNPSRSRGYERELNDRQLREVEAAMLPELALHGYA